MGMEINWEKRGGNQSVTAKEKPVFAVAYEVEGGSVMWLLLSWEPCLSSESPDTERDAEDGSVDSVLGVQAWEQESSFLQHPL